MDVTLFRWNFFQYGYLVLYLFWTENDFSLEVLPWEMFFSLDFRNCWTSNEKPHYDFWDPTIVLQNIVLQHIVLQNTRQISRELFWPFTSVTVFKLSTFVSKLCLCIDSTKSSYHWSCSARFIFLSSRTINSIEKSMKVLQINQTHPKLLSV